MFAKARASGRGNDRTCSLKDRRALFRAAPSIARGSLSRQGKREHAPVLEEPCARPKRGTQGSKGGAGRTKEKEKEGEEENACFCLKSIIPFFFLCFRRAHDEAQIGRRHEAENVTENTDSDLLLAFRETKRGEASTAAGRRRWRPGPISPSLFAVRPLPVLSVFPSSPRSARCCPCRPLCATS